MSTRDYSVFGLTVRSEIDLPELVETEPSDLPDIGIVVGSVVTQPGGGWLQGSGQSLILVVPEIAKYSIEHGRRIVVDAEARVPERNVRLYLLGSAFGALLHQRGLLPLHANAVELGGKAVAFMGESGAGKSTLAAWFHDRGHRVIADDVCVVTFADERAWACPGLPRLRLWEEALQASGRDLNAYPLSYLGDPDLRKYDVALGKSGQELRELAAAFVLERGDRFDVEKLNGSEAAEAVFAHTYRGRYLRKVNGEHGHWSAVIAFVRQVPVYRLQREWGLDRLDDQGAQILDLIAENAL